MMLLDKADIANLQYMLDWSVIGVYFIYMAQCISIGCSVCVALTWMKYV